MANVGYVGLGDMGGRIAKRLLDAGHAVTGYNRTRSKAAWLFEHGLRLAETPRAAAEASEIVCSMVTDTNALLAVFDGPDGILAGLDKGKVYADMSTVSPAVSRELAAKVAEVGAGMLDCPISGSPSTVEKGEASVMVGGDEAALERALPVLEAVGASVIHVGANGQAVLMKTAINLSLAVQFAAFSEGLLIAEKGGIPRDVAVRAFMASVVASPSLAYRAPFVDELPDPAWFGVGMMQKDMLLALESGRNLGVPMPTTAATNELLTATRGMGLADEDFAVIYHALARIAGVRQSPS
jgi:3-hydroxyisobutyrate dehydrogenase-like beta-hydroxyacid dehydrogenase